MRISDWSSDVCSSDLRAQHQKFHGQIPRRAGDCFPRSAAFRDSFGRFGRRLLAPDAITSADQGNRPCSSGGAFTAAERRHARTVGAVGVRVSTSAPARSEEHTSELQSLMRTSYAVFCLKKKKQK